MVPPQSVQELVKNKHTILIQKDAGIGAGFSNSDYELSGAKIVNSAEDIFNDSEMIVKVKEPLMNEVEMLRVFNLGIGYCVIVPANRAEFAMSVIRDDTLADCWQIGEIVLES